METCPPRACSKRRHCLSIDAATKYFCNIAGEEPMGTCEPCADLRSTDECADRSKSELSFQECADVCEDVVITSCLTNDNCRDNFFCNNNSTICQACPIKDYIPDWHVDQCYNASQMGLYDDDSQTNCAISCHTECNAIMEGSISVEGAADIGKDNNIPMKGTPYASVAGALVDCQFGGEGECSADAPDDFVCLVSRGVRKFSDKALNCEESGGVAIVMFNNEENGDIVDGTVGDAPVEIPITAISLQDGYNLLEHGLGLETKVVVKNLGEECDRGCSNIIPCPSSPGSWYCDYQLETHGYCQECGSDEAEQRVECFLSGLPLEGAQECANTCESTLTSSSCKICGKGISGSNLQSGAEGEATCNFCPDGLKKSHWDRVIPFIGSNATCFKLNQFFLNYPIAENDHNCQLALNFNYICDCEGPGYAGADSDAKRKVLVWFPRVSGILSFLSSSAIILDIARDRKKRRKLYGQLMLTMSVFDLMGSAAYSLTTLPMPKEYYIEGSKGNDATCTAQGFFIQMGTTSAFVNVSLALYYYCIIKLSWTETRMKKIRIWLFLCPITVGLVFAFAGIPFYDMLFLWCNNSAAWWPEVPIIGAILLTTCAMTSVCLAVYKTENASHTYSSRRESNRQTISSVVFWQSIWYLLSFYLTWPPYLALQYLWAGGSGYSSYGLVLVASTLVPLQGFWNCVVFFRVRAKKKMAHVMSRFSQGGESDVGGQENSAADSNVSGENLSAQPIFGAIENSGDVGNETALEGNGDEGIHLPDTPTETQEAHVANGSTKAFDLEQSGSDVSENHSADEPQNEAVCLDNGWVGMLTSSIR